MSSRYTIKILLKIIKLNHQNEMSVSNLVVIIQQTIFKMPTITELEMDLISKILIFLYFHSKTLKIFFVI